MKKNKILVTGGAGFIGSHLVDQLVELGHNVTVIDDFSYGKKKNVNKKAKLIKVNVLDKKIISIFEKNRFDIVFHLAAQKNVRVSVDDPQKDAQDNILGSLNLLECCKKFKVKKFIFTSTGGVIYGDTNKLPTPEDHAPWPVCPYGVAKLSVEKYLHYYQQVHNLSYVSLRLGNVFGPRQDPKGEAGVVAIFIEQLMKNKQPIINGNGKQTRDYIYVADVVQAHVKAIDKKADGIYNVGTSKQTNVNDLFKKIVKSMSLKTKEKHGKAVVGEQMKSCLNISRIKKDLDFKLNFNLDQGIKQTVSWFKKNN